MSQTTAWTSEQLEGVRNAITPVVGRQVADASLRDDIVQETLWRVVRAAPNLEASTLRGYAVVVAKNAIVAEYRSEKRRTRAHSRFGVSVDESDSIDAGLLTSEEAYALQAALEQLSPQDRRLLIDHHVMNHSVEELAARSATSSGSMAVRLARSRARLRVAFLLGFRRITLPSATCEPVLQALSSGDRRQQARLCAGDHLGQCATCARLAPALVERKRSLAVLAPVGLIADALRRSAHTVRNHPVLSGGGATAVAVASSLVALNAAGSTPPPPAPPAKSLCSGVVTLDGKTPGVDLAGAPPNGSPAILTAAPVTEVSADEGFWVGCGDFRMWVELTGAGESSVDIDAGNHFTANGIVRLHGPGYAKTVGVAAAEQSAVDSLGYHIEVAKPH